MEAIVREARSGEEHAVLAAYEWLFAPPGFTPAGWEPEAARARLAAAVADSESLVLVAEGGGEIVGLVCAYIDIESVRFGRRCWVEDLAVHPERRSAGLGARLLEAARAWARERGATHVELTSALARTDAHRFYDRQGEAAKGLTYAWRL